MLRKILPVLLVIAFGIGAGCTTAPQSGGGGSAGLLRVGVAADYPPIVFKQDGIITGLDADLAFNLAAQLGKKCKFVELSWDNLIPALMDGRVDIIMSGMTITAERKVRIAFGNPYLKVGQIALARRTDIPKFASTVQIMMTSARVGVQKGTTGDQLVQQKFINAQKITFLTPADAAVNLTRNRIDLLIHDAPLIWWLASEYESTLAGINLPLTEEYLGWGIRRNDEALIEAANQILAKWKKDGTLDRLYKRWVPYAM